MIVITKQTHKGLSVFIGSVAVHVVKYAKCPVIVLPDE
jgi:nucleotide-binding universal stress UspA family protein